MAPMRLAIAALALASAAAAPYFARTRRLFLETNLFDFSVEAFDLTEAGAVEMGNAPIEVNLAEPMTFFQEERSQLLVSKQGYVAVPRGDRLTTPLWSASWLAPVDDATYSSGRDGAYGTLFPSSWSVPSAQGWPTVIAGLWSDNDATTGSATCGGTPEVCGDRFLNRVYVEYFTESTTDALQLSKIERLRNLISQQGGGASFHARQMMIATYYRVTPFGDTSSAVYNTYQIVVADDVHGNTYVTTLYPTIGWTGSVCKVPRNAILDSNIPPAIIGYEPCPPDQLVDGYAGIDNGVDAEASFVDYIGSGAAHSLATTNTGIWIYKTAGPLVVPVNHCPCYEAPVGSAWLTPFAPTPTQTPPNTVLPTDYYVNGY